MSSSILLPTLSNNYNRIDIHLKSIQDLEKLTELNTKALQQQEALKQQQQQDNFEIQTMIINGKKWKFDKSVNKYVEFKTSNFDMIKIEYNECMRNLMTQINYKLNIKLNKEVGINRLKILRHSYFESIEKINDMVILSIEKNGFKYTNSIEKTSKQNIEFLNVNPFNEDQINEKLHNFGKLNIRTILKSSKFWNNCYQDLKFESMSIGGSFYDIFPTINKLIDFFQDFINFFLISINNLKPNIGNVKSFGGNGNTDEEKSKNENEYNRLKKFNFLFFTDSDYDILNKLKIHFNQLFFDQSQINGNDSNPFQIYNFNFVLNKLIDVIISNLKTFKLPHEIEVVWKEFFEYSFNTLLNDQEVIKPSLQQQKQNKQNKQSLAGSNTSVLQQPTPPSQPSSLFKTSTNSTSSSSSTYNNFTIPTTPSSMSPSYKPKQNFIPSTPPSPMRSPSNSSVIAPPNGRNHSINSINSDKTTYSKRNGSIFTNESFNSSNLNSNSLTYSPTSITTNSTSTTNSNNDLNSNNLTNNIINDYVGDSSFEDSNDLSTLSTSSNSKKKKINFFKRFGKSKN
ncbi:uncharacterized protein KGF55_002186 [Candida pseudojiufengensis]|uniref:uncharacterized protein n=1 Tax=Candida pseudojiufengensis TaxID=497109 RepID=UPI00222401A5|nr:uncharacterized protein KGF55_002186 [Candida pseudojiufengensis]KAI5964244.1 hypothetical protein KGF55_002186 [Candida pseudojiufengensis]